jgi:hypothetical protein
MASGRLRCWKSATSSFAEVVFGSGTTGIFVLPLLLAFGVRAAEPEPPEAESIRPGLHLGAEIWTGSFLGAGDYGARITASPTRISAFR